MDDVEVINEGRARERQFLFSPALVNGYCFPQRHLVETSRKSST